MLPSLQSLQVKSATNQVFFQINRNGECFPNSYILSFHSHGWRVSLSTHNKQSPSSSGVTLHLLMSGAGIWSVLPIRFYMAVRLSENISLHMHNLFSLFLYCGLLLTHGFTVSHWHHHACWWCHALCACFSHWLNPFIYLFHVFSVRVATRISLDDITFPSQLCFQPWFVHDSEECVFVYTLWYWLQGRPETAEP